ncbi:MAG: hypothetical protein KDB14_05570, partial [Planctomycetales bacterium]|nr:hypothetical protein [Planctomycetales bacterium]
AQSGCAALHGRGRARAPMLRGSAPRPAQWVAQCCTGEDAHATREIVVVQAASLQSALKTTTFTG